MIVAPIAVYNVNMRSTVYSSFYLVVVVVAAATIVVVVVVIVVVVLANFLTCD